MLRENSMWRAIWSKNIYYEVVSENNITVSLFRFEELNYTNKPLSLY